MAPMFESDFLGSACPPPFLSVESNSKVTSDSPVAVPYLCKRQIYESLRVPSWLEAYT